MTPNSELKDVIQIPIEDWIDLHTFSPKEIPSLLEEYLRNVRRKVLKKFESSMAREKGFNEISFIRYLKRALSLNHSDQPLRKQAPGEPL